MVVKEKDIVLQKKIGVHTSGKLKFGLDKDIKIGVGIVIVVNLMLIPILIVIRKLVILKRTPIEIDMVDTGVDMIVHAEEIDGKRMN